VEGGTRDGTSQGKKKRIANFIVRFMDTVGAKVGPDADNLQVIPFRNFGDNMSTPIALYTGDKKVDTFPGPVSTDCYFRIVQDDPLPMTILSIMPTIMVSDL